MAALGVGGLGDAVERHGMVWSHVPIPDLSAPDEQAFKAADVINRRALDVAWVTMPNWYNKGRMERIGWGMDRPVFDVMRDRYPCW